MGHLFAVLKRSVDVLETPRPSILGFDSLLSVDAPLLSWAGGASHVPQELYDVLEMGQSIIFCRTKMDADNITNTLQVCPRRGSWGIS